MGTARGAHVSRAVLPCQTVSPFDCNARTASTYDRMSASVAGRAARLRIALSPEPMPKNARPGAISSMVAIPDAATAGCRVTGFVTAGPMRTRPVACAQSAIVVYSSRKTDWLSATPTSEKPTSSARRASATADATDRGKQRRPSRAPPPRITCGTSPDPQRGEPEGERREHNEQHADGQEEQEERQAPPDHLRQLSAGHALDHEQVEADRRGQKPPPEQHGHENAEPHPVETPP